MIHSEMFSCTIAFNPLGSVNFQACRYQDLEFYLIGKGILFPWSMKWISNSKSSIHSFHWFIFCCLSVKTHLCEEYEFMLFFFLHFLFVYFIPLSLTWLLFPLHFKKKTKQKKTKKTKTHHITQSFLTLYHFVY